MFLIRLIPAVITLVAVVVTVYLIIVLLNRGLQWLLKSVGYELGDFGKFLKSIRFKKKKRKNGKSCNTHTGGDHPDSGNIP